MSNIDLEEFAKTINKAIARAEKVEAEVSALVATIKVNEEDHTLMVKRIEADKQKAELERDKAIEERKKNHAELVDAMRLIKARAEKAEGEAYAYKRDFEAELAGNKHYRERFGARDDETMEMFYERLVRERDEAKATLETYRSVAGVAERTAEELRERSVEANARLKKVERELADARASRDGWIEAERKARLERDETEEGSEEFRKGFAKAQEEHSVSEGVIADLDLGLADLRENQIPTLIDRVKTLERQVADHDCVMVNDSERHRHEKHEARINALESLLLDPSDCKGCRGLCHACDR